MKLASLKEGGRDGTLIVVSRDLKTAVKVTNIATTLKEVLYNWENTAPALVEVLDSLQAALTSAQAQDEQAACYAHKIEKAEAELDWSLDAQDLRRKILAFNPSPVVWTLLHGERLKLWSAESIAGGSAADRGRPGEILSRDGSGITVACGRGGLRLTRLQLPGGKPLQVSQLLHSRSDMFACGVVMGH